MILIDKQYAINVVQSTHFSLKHMHGIKHNTEYSSRFFFALLLVVVVIIVCVCVCVYEDLLKNNQYSSNVSSRELHLKV